MNSQKKGIPFAFICSLFREISKVKPRTVTNRKKYDARSSHEVLDVFKRWVTELHKRFSPLPKGTTASCFRLLFPDEDTKRKFNMQENKLACYLMECLASHSDRLTNWDNNAASGCLGHELEVVLQQKYTGLEDSDNLLTVAEVDELLDELASISGFSHASIRSKYAHKNHYSKLETLKKLYRRLLPAEASFLTQIILKDLRPVLYPVPDVHYSVALLDFNSNAIQVLTKEQAMSVWDNSGRMLKVYRIKRCLDEATLAYEDGPDKFRQHLKPDIGIMIQIPKSFKGTSCHHALSRFPNSSTVWTETKYDGERAQIHVNVLENGLSEITIFSKSGRDSTKDRYGVHDIVRRALRLVPSQVSLSRPRKTLRNIVLDAEMVAWNEDHIDEFWRIQSLIEQTALGVRGKSKLKDVSHRLNSDAQSLSIIDSNQSQHLALIFFDILVLNSEFLIFQPYSYRRQQLEAFVQPIPTRAMFAERFAIDMSGSNSLQRLHSIFARHLADHKEGIILKADESLYNDPRHPWVKFKKDYIKGFGDCIDMVIAAVGWDRERARELRVAPDVYTTFYIGAITNVDEIRRKPDTKAHILLYFTASYGLSRKELEDLNARVRGGDNVPFSSSPKITSNLAFTFTLSKKLKEPMILLHTPLLAEILCSGFTKEHQSNHYELRFPRITKIHRRIERPWTESIDILELDKIAQACVGNERADKDIDDWCNSLWGKPCSPNLAMKRQARVRKLEETLAAMDQVALDPDRSSTSVEKRRKLDQSGEKLGLAKPFGAIDAKNGKLEKTELHASSLEVGASINLAGAMFFFCGQNGNSCANCLHWKRGIPKEQRVHSLEALLSVNGQSVEGDIGMPVKQGIVIVDRNDATAKKTVLEMVSREGRSKAQIMVFTCDVTRFEEQSAVAL